MLLKYPLEFLTRLDNTNLKTKYARITLLTQQELPVCSLEGIISQGSLNVDGNSAVRRSCSLTMVSKEPIQTVYRWARNNKFKLEIGLKNDIDSRYPETIWFPQGIYVFTSISASHSNNGLNISLQGKDKGCLINGEVAGSLTTSVDFGQINEQDETGIVSTKKYELKEIIKRIMHDFAGEPYQNIEVNDLDGYGLELLEYAYEEPMYLYRKTDSDVYTNVFLESLAPSISYIDSKGDSHDIILKDASADFFDPLNGLIDLPEGQAVSIDDLPGTYHLLKISYGETVGYKKVPLVYGGELLAAAGDSITSVLDKIKNMLGEYEYFYNVNGRFIFQKKESFVNTLLSSGEERYRGEIYSFKDTQLTSSYNNTPKIQDIKNDYSIYGTRKTLSGQEKSINFRFALHEKPVSYTTIKVDLTDEEIKAYKDKYGREIKIPEGQVTYISSDSFSKETNEGKTIVKCDWRELLYHMARDKFYYDLLSDFELRVAEANPTYFPLGTTGYEQYYTEMLSYWKDLYYPEIVVQENIEKIETINGNISRLKEEISQLTKEIDDLENRKGSFDQLGNDNRGIKQIELRNKELSSIFKTLLPQEQLNIEDYPYGGGITIAFKFSAPEIQITERLEAEKTRRQSNKQSTEWIGTTPTAQIVTTEEIQANLKAPEAQVITQEGIQVSLKAPEVQVIEMMNQPEAHEEYLYNLTRLITLTSERDTLLNLIKQKNEVLLEYETQKVEYDISFDRKSYKDYVSDVNSKYFGWNKNVVYAPYKLNFWIDFLDSGGEIQKYNVALMGQRSKTINDKEIKALSFRQTPEIIFTNSQLDESSEDGYRYIQIKGIDNYFYKSSQKLSAEDKLNELLYKNLYSTESVTINAIPIYYLQPNTRIYLSDPDSDIEGEYILSKISLPLNYNGTMSITAIKAVKNLV